jgi:adenylate cyclase
MPDDPVSRRLTTIVALDVAGYSARTEADEAKTTAEVAALRRVIEGITTAKGGRVFNTAGDGFMLEFGSSLAAVEAAFALADKCEPKVRVGVHLGDVVVQPNGDLLGHGVNVAARLMARSDPGSVLVSADVRRTIRGPLAKRLVSRGSLQLDKMTETIEAFALGSAASVKVATPPASTEPLLAVLPFDNLSDDREMQFFSDGVSEEIIQRLSRGAQMKVIGRTSSFQFRGADKTARKVAKELHCSHILDGSIRRAGGRVRITAHLVEAASQTTLWSDRYDRILEDIFAVRDLRTHRGRPRPDLHELLNQGDRSGGLRPLSARQPRVPCARRAPDKHRPVASRYAARPQFRRSLGSARLFAGLVALLSALCRSRCERRPNGERSRAGSGSAQRRRPVSAVLRHPPLSDDSSKPTRSWAYRASARPRRWRNLRRLALPGHRAAS